MLLCRHDVSNSRTAFAGASIRNRIRDCSSVWNLSQIGFAAETVVPTPIPGHEAGAGNRPQAERKRLCGVAALDDVLTWSLGEIVRDIVHESIDPGFRHGLFKNAHAQLVGERVFDFCQANMREPRL